MLPPPPACLRTTDGLLTLPSQPEFDIAKAESASGGRTSGSKVMAKVPVPVLSPKERMGDGRREPCLWGHTDRKPTEWVPASGTGRLLVGLGVGVFWEILSPRYPELPSPAVS